MEIIIKEAAKEYLENQLDVEKDLLLAADDGSNEYSKIGGSCAIGDKFQIVATTHKNNNYLHICQFHHKLLQRMKYYLQT